MNLEGCGFCCCSKEIVCVLILQKRAVMRSLIEQGDSRVHALVYPALVCRYIMICNVCRLSSFLPETARLEAATGCEASKQRDQ